MISEYKACGAQLRVPTEDKGISFEAFHALQLKALVTPRVQVNEKLEGPKAGKKKASGSLPNNAEWL